MPRAYRSMKQEGDPPRPQLGDSASKLGVRPNDLAPNENGDAIPGKGGMSVFPSIACIERRFKHGFPPRMIPSRLNESGKVPGAIGPDSFRVFRLGEGEFVKGPIAIDLELVPDHDDHGTIQPAQAMPYEEYKNAIANTKEHWVNGEEDA